MVMGWFIHTMENLFLNLILFSISISFGYRIEKKNHFKYPLRLVQLNRSVMMWVNKNLKQKRQENIAVSLSLSLVTHNTDRKRRKSGHGEESKEQRGRHWPFLEEDQPSREQEKAAK